MAKGKRYEKAALSSSSSKAKNTSPQRDDISSSEGLKSNSKKNNGIN